jgi:ABC-type phosphate transport system substrate-binding protein
MHKTVNLVVFVLFVFACLSAATCVAQENGAKGIALKGSNATASLIQPWIADFERDYPGKRVVLSASTHSRHFANRLGIIW